MMHRDVLEETQKRHVWQPSHRESAPALAVWAQALLQNRNARV